MLFGIKDFWHWFLFLPLLLAAFVSSAKMTLVPDRTQAVEQGETSLANIWNHALRNQKNEDGTPLRHLGPGPRTIISPNPFKMMNLVPQDGPHPLYSNKYVDMRTEFLLDYMVEKAVSREDPAMTSVDGLVIENLNGKSLAFKKNDEKITINGEDVEDFKILPDGTILYQISNFLFDHKMQVDEARKVLNKETPRFGPLGRPLDMPIPPQPSE